MVTWINKQITVKFTAVRDPETNILYQTPLCLVGRKGVVKDFKSGPHNRTILVVEPTDGKSVPREVKDDVLFECFVIDSTHVQT